MNKHIKYFLIIFFVFTALSWLIGSRIVYYDAYLNLSIRKYLSVLYFCVFVISSLLSIIIYKEKIKLVKIFLSLYILCIILIILR